MNVPKYNLETSNLLILKAKEKRYNNFRIKLDTYQINEGDLIDFRLQLLCLTGK